MQEQVVIAGGDILHFLYSVQMTISGIHPMESTASHTEGFALTLKGWGTNNECLLEWVSLGADLSGSRLQGNALLCHSCNWRCR